MTCHEPPLAATRHNVCLPVGSYLPSVIPVKKKISVPSREYRGRPAQGFPSSASFAGAVDPSLGTVPHVQCVGSSAA